MPLENKKTTDYKEYVQAREFILNDLQTELVGPENDPGIIFENPVPRYAAGILFPSEYGQKEDSKDMEDPEDASDKEEGESEDDFSDDMTAALANNFFPSAMAMSFYGLGKDPELKVTVKAATYKKTTDLKDIYVRAPGIQPEVTILKEFVENFEYADEIIRLKDRPDGSRDLEASLKETIPETVKHKLYKLLRSQTQGAWLREEHTGQVVIVAGMKRISVFNGMDIVVVRKYLQDKDMTLFTVALENKMPSSGVSETGVFFQTSFSVESSSGSVVFAEYGHSDTKTEDPEDTNLAMLYRNKKTYAVGHGCAAEWSVVDGRPVLLRSAAIPTYEVPQASFDIAELSGTKTLEMHFMSGLSGSDEEILESLSGFCDLYGNWIVALKGQMTSLPNPYIEQGKKNIGLCEEVLARMRSGLEILKNDVKAFAAFKMANRAMLMQSLHSDLQKIRRSPGDPAPSWPDVESQSAHTKRWRPFQLAFLLLSLRGTVDPSSDDRQIVDLIWFPTGGGKTEAYLGLSAFTILYQRMTSDVEKFGTAIMMRYTLRLLTAQQFQRACTLICALEILRREDPELLGEEEISIGLWVGSASTPNSINEAKKKYEDFLTNSYSPCPSPVLSCPWCGTRMVLESGGRREYAMRDKARPRRIELFCKEDSCKFNGRTSVLPIKFIDEDIYTAPPTLLFGTVDKFAQMPRRQGVSEIFGLNGGAGPQLIIQDELHLISGALGTMVALYETAVDFLASRNRAAPKIIASTATVRRAGEQCKNLFGRMYRQFPAPGLNIEDSFFAKDDLERPGRIYAGVMPSGKTQTTTAVRLTAKLLQSVYEMPQPNEVKDKYWTLVSYFNSIRELGGYISLVNDDISLYAKNLLSRYGRHMRPIFETKELTSREKAEKILEILEQLSVEYKGDEESERRQKDRPIDIIVATNMISVGVDIDRFGLMLLRGQPKMTSEYIQVSSRVGRRYPGLAIMLYNPARTRDRAHYERFTTYHGSFYRNVEPSSITPFSLPARTRALNAILVTMVRHSLATPQINEEKGVAEFKHDLPGVAEIKEFILKRVSIVDPSEIREVEADIDRAWQEWESFAAGFVGSAEAPVYSSFMTRTAVPALLASSSKEKRPIGWVAPNSMRNVDAESIINTLDE